MGDFLGSKECICHFWQLLCQTCFKKWDFMRVLWAGLFWPTARCASALALPFRYKVKWKCGLVDDVPRRSGWHWWHWQVREASHCARVRLIWAMNGGPEPLGVRCSRSLEAVRGFPVLHEPGVGDVFVLGGVCTPCRPFAQSWGVSHRQVSRYPSYG